MTDEPTPNTTDGRNDSDSTGSDEEGMVIDDGETVERFLEDRAAEEYPTVLRITAEAESTHRQGTLDRLERWKAGEDVPHLINFENPSDLRALLTDCRVELLRSIMADKPESIRQLADRLGRDVKTVHDDLAVLSEYDVVHYEQVGRAKRPFVPYETIEVSLEISTPGTADDSVSA